MTGLTEALRTGTFDALQIPYNPWERDAERQLLPLAAAMGVSVIAMRPLGGSGEDGRRAIQPSAADLALLGCESWAEALLRWALADERIDAVIPATSRPDRATANARAAAVRRCIPTSARSSNAWRVPGECRLPPACGLASPKRSSPTSIGSHSHLRARWSC
jgi:aryl-alcohol dehydrogenase-like predicted oxidoreductase